MADGSTFHCGWVSTVNCIAELHIYVWPQFKLVAVHCGSNTFNADWLRSISIYCTQSGFIAYLLQRHCISIADAQPWLQAVVFFNISIQLQPIHGSMEIVTDSGRLRRMDIHFIADSYPPWIVSLKRVCVLTLSVSLRSSCRRVKLGLWCVQAYKYCLHSK